MNKKMTDKEKMLEAIKELSLKVKTTKVKINHKDLIELVGESVLELPNGFTFKTDDTIVELDANTRHPHTIGVEFSFDKKQPAKKAKPTKVNKVEKTKEKVAEKEGE